MSPHSEDLNERDLFGNEPDDGISLGSVLALALAAVAILGAVIWWLL